MLVFQLSRPKQRPQGGINLRVSFGPTSAHVEQKRDLQPCSRAECWFSESTSDVEEGPRRPVHVGHSSTGESTVAMCFEVAQCLEVVQGWRRRVNEPRRGEGAGTQPSDLDSPEEGGVG